MSTLPEEIAAGLESHDAFARADDAFALETTVFETQIDAEPAPDKRAGRFHVTVTLPTLDAAVAGETVASVVEDGWFETLERRLEDVYTVAYTDTHDDPVVEREASNVTVSLEYSAWDAGEGVEDAKTLVEYVEGTYAQGIIPGYEYRGPAATLLENAQGRGQQASEGESGGMPM
ncbi:DUF5813 family protein [Natronorubrum daqingense]|uniref:YbjN domain-containing protein n=1 Tax=Natronorubrum daqingense TaxID=588898 RepID=A0A1N7CVI2_9EURY|nr:DUF5813 family protein [Natronorubrum daqingense]APX97075.1 hypothetical protein BB347_10820 [Natronorubrum daqingense]SIR67485.1 hypothetical protein SAMN05421809_1898 [Natronorubrum daqingense]